MPVARSSGPRTPGHATTGSRDSTTMMRRSCTTTGSDTTIRSWARRLDGAGWKVVDGDASTYSSLGPTVTADPGGESRQATLGSFSAGVGCGRRRGRRRALRGSHSRPSRENDGAVHVVLGRVGRNRSRVPGGAGQGKHRGIEGRPRRALTVGIRTTRRLHRCRARLVAEGRASPAALLDALACGVPR